MTFLERISALCQEKQLTFYKLEKTLGWGQSTISRWETSSPSADKLQKIADYFNVSVDYLLGRTPDNFFSSESEVAMYADGGHKKHSANEAESLDKIFRENGITPERLNSLSESKKELIIKLIKEMTEK